MKILPKCLSSIMCFLYRCCKYTVKHNKLSINATIMFLMVSYIGPKAKVLKAVFNCYLPIDILMFQVFRFCQAGRGSISV